MPGLPSRYMKKFGMAKGWKEYKKDQRAKKRKKKATKKATKKSPAKKRTVKKKTVARRVSISSRKGATMPRKRKRVVRRARSVARKVRRRVSPAARNIVSSTTKAAMATGIGVAGAIGTAAVVNMLPVEGRMKALTQAGLGTAILLLAPKRAKALRVAGMGASMAGALALVKNSGLPLPLLAGYETGYMGINYRPRMGINYRPQPVKAPAVQPAPKMSGPGYGRRFVTPANL